MHQGPEDGREVKEERRSPGASGKGIAVGRVGQKRSGAASWGPEAFDIGADDAAEVGTARRCSLCGWTRCKGVASGH